MDLTHASFFSGVGGLDLGLERAGWRTVSFSEIDPYASAVLAQRWPRVPNLGSIVDVCTTEQNALAYGASDVDAAATGIEGRGWRDATLWSGGFPCQDLSVAGKRRGMVEGTRSGLAYSFLALAELHRPRFILLENVPGLLSSHGGRDMAALLGALVELGYGVGYRILDARYFGVPQRRRRVFILGVSPGGRAGAEFAAEVLSVGSRCYRHPPPGIEAGPGATERARSGIDIARAVTGTSGKRHDDDTDTLIPTIRSHPRPGSNSDGVITLVGPSPDSGGVRAPDGLAGRAHHRDGLAATLNSGGNSGGFRTEPGEHLVRTLRVGAATNADGGPGDTVPIIVGESAPSGPDDLLPLGLDSHRYRCAGNGVGSAVSEWIGWRLAELLQSDKL